jgi:predicted dienelactone hydrolase
VMRPLEIVLPILIGAYVLWPAVAGRRRPRWVSGIPFLAGVVLLLHLFLEGDRWQMIPLYLLAGVTGCAGAWELWRPRTGEFKRRSWRGAGLVGAAVVVAAAAALPVLLPVPSVLPPTGPYAVGAVTLELVDDARAEIYADGAGAPRRFLIQIWYPALPERGDRRAPWMDDAGIVAPAIADWLDLPPFFLDHLELARTSSYLEAPVDPSGAPYPVLIFSHGWGGFRAQNTFQLQELASHGYVVVGMEHTYGAVVTVFPDGQVDYNDPAALPDGVPDSEYQVAARRLVQQWIGDIAFALDTLEAWDRMDPAGRFTGFLDGTRVGVLGHSTGGGAAVEFCATDLRCDAGLGMDVWMTPVTEATLDGGVVQPFLFLFSEQWPTAKNMALFERLRRGSNPADRTITILGADHYDFSDLPALSPLAPQLGLKGPIPGARVQRIITDFSLAFFGAALKGQVTRLLEGPSSAYPEARFDG